MLLAVALECDRTKLCFARFIFGRVRVDPHDSTAATLRVLHVLTDEEPGKIIFAPVELFLACRFALKSSRVRGNRHARIAKNVVFNFFLPSECVNPVLDNCVRRLVRRHRFVLLMRQRRDAGSRVCRRGIGQVEPDCMPVPVAKSQVEALAQP